jgi:hypothetical protein
MNNTVRRQDMPLEARFPTGADGAFATAAAKTNLPRFGESISIAAHRCCRSIPTKARDHHRHQPSHRRQDDDGEHPIALAYGGSRVLLVDADMPARPAPPAAADQRARLSQVLTDQARVRDVIQRTVDPNLLAITAGRTLPTRRNCSSERMKTLLQPRARSVQLDHHRHAAGARRDRRGDPAPDGDRRTRHRAEMTRRRLAERAIETVMQARPRYAAVVLNKVNFAKNKYYYSRYYGHQYKNYYAEAAL